MVKLLLIAVLKKILIVCGFFGLIILVLAFTDLPYYAYYDLALTEKISDQKTDYIVLLGGDGMPSPDGLIRSYYTAAKANADTNAKIIIALPKNEDGSSKQLDLYRDELMIKGISSERILYESSGFNTYTQVVNISKLVDSSNSICIVSSPEHIYRAYACFKAIGFQNLSTLPCFEVPNEESVLKDKKKKILSSGQFLSIRYNFWSYLQYEVKVAREYAAISYYKFRSWI